MTPSRGYNSASDTLFRLKLTEDIEQKLRKTMLALFDHQSGFTQVTDSTRENMSLNNTSLIKNYQ